MTPTSGGETGSSDGLSTTWIAPVAPPPADSVPAERLHAELGRRLHVWVVRVASPLSNAWAEQHEPMLSAIERGRHRRYKRDSSRALFLVAHVAVRQILSRYAPVDPAEWEFELNDHGRPEPTHPAAPPGLRANLSHTGGMVAIVVHDGADAGVDVERIDRSTDIVRLSASVFADTERHGFLALPADQQANRFFRLWTLKEAFIKAKGMGLALPLKDFAFDLGKTGPTDVSIACEPSIGEAAHAWSFAVHQLTDVHMLATACRSGNAVPPRPVDIYDATEALGLA